ncbi:MAG: hypothetical protein HON90_13585 [Halobacteriovoraceae bacterium]|jgi:hypothetical protein|nr:hypothetical protein [Halobacteriovoraceae bacterium]
MYFIRSKCLKFSHINISLPVKYTEKSCVIYYTGSRAKHLNLEGVSDYMNKEIEEDLSNLIEVSFGSTIVSPDLNPCHDFDPLEDLLHEFEDADIDIKLPQLKEQSRIFNEHKVNFSDSTLEMTDKIFEQTKEIKLNLKKLKYYLNEMNLDRD